MAIPSPPVPEPVAPAINVVAIPRDKRGVPPMPNNALMIVWKPVDAFTTAPNPTTASDLSTEIFMINNNCNQNTDGHRNQYVKGEQVQ